MSNTPVSPPNLYDTDPLTLACQLLGAHLTTPTMSAIIVEVEAYGSGPDGPWPDPASHAYRGPTPRNNAMFGPPGHLYIYQIYGTHTCANIVCGPDNTPGAVLLRAARIINGHHHAYHHRPPTTPPHKLASGPANLCKAFSITQAHNHLNLTDPTSPIHLHPATTTHPYRTGPRTGVTRAATRPWRFWLTDFPEVSAYKPSPRASEHSD